MNKYGIEHFHISLLEECPNDKVAEREIYWIKEKNSYMNGYNATYGGEGRLEFDYEAIVDLYKSGKNLFEIASIIGCSQDTAHKAISSQGINILENNTQKAKEEYGKKCKCFDKDGNLIGIFLSLNEAANFIISNNYSTANLRGISTNIGRVCNGKRKSAYGFYWQYVNEFDINNNERNIPKKILQLDKNGNFIKEYNNVHEAAREIGGSYSFIQRVLKQPSRTAYGYKWKYKEN